ncbi:hypothetical protein SAMN06297144_1391 [Sphingomonas guangdongensis]|uniref:SPW repeat-containing protein n=1 Tax=Sphingomonas guangdongensis TaxID=1141890 RepID=A0A285QLW9_9SPHN|nr:XrtV sorting system accessory protein [Sphingomonas guangdongensis]SOB81092.1 hypothetical protein SAMN06297144_1391 [Sphingomonas guangdongensis]
METVYDWVSILIFAGLVTLFLQRSIAETEVDSIWHYLPPALGCAIGNQLGNNDWPVPAVTLFLATLAYIWYVLKPGRVQNSGD